MVKKIVNCHQQFLSNFLWAEVFIRLTLENQLINTLFLLRPEILRAEEEIMLSLIKYPDQSLAGTGNKGMQLEKELPKPKCMPGSTNFQSFNLIFKLYNVFPTAYFFSKII